MSTPYDGLTEAELVAIRSALVTRLTAAASGEDFQSVTVGGKSFSRFVNSIEQVRSELSWVNAALQEINPDDYGRRITRTVARFI